MNRIKIRLKLLLKCVYINHFAKFSIGKGSGVGAFSKIIFSSDGGNDSDQGITIGNYGGTGRNCELHVWDNNQIQIKDYSTLNDGCKILGDVTIERFCLLSANIFASSGNHYALVKPNWLIKDQDEFVLSTNEGRQQHSEPIHIEEDCWIGVGVFIKRGVYIGRGAIIGANSVVMKDVAPYSIQGGLPCKEIKKRLVFDPPNEISYADDDHLPYFYRGFEIRQKELKTSRSNKVIHALNNSIVVLKRTTEFEGLIIKGTKNRENELDLLITWQNIWQWNLKINEKNFELKLSKDNAKEIKSSTGMHMHKPLAFLMENYNVICVLVQNNNSYGIERVKQLKS